MGVVIVDDEWDFVRNRETFPIVSKRKFLHIVLDIFSPEIHKKLRTCIRCY